MELTQDQVNRIVDIADEYQIELDAAAKRFRRRLGEVGLAVGPAGRLVERERYYRPEPPKVPRDLFHSYLRGGSSTPSSPMPRITMDEDDSCCSSCGYLPPRHAPGCEVDTDEERGH